MTLRRLTDRTALAYHRNRAHGAWFLHEAAHLEIQERLTDINRAFTSPALVTGAPKIWGPAFPMAKIVCDTERLELAPQAHDLVIHAMALHWADDPVGQLVQCRRALQPDGLCLAVAFGGQTLHELRTSLAEAEIAETGGLSPRVLPMAEVRDMGALLQRAGLALPVADTVKIPVVYDTMFHLIKDLRAMGETNALADRQKKYPSRGLFDRAAHIYQKSFGTKDGRITATFDLIFLAGWCPSEDQPKPLRPGSATHSLIEVLDKEKSER